MAEKVTDKQIEEFLALFDSPLDGVHSVAAYIRKSRQDSATSQKKHQTPTTPVIISLQDVSKSYKIGRQPLIALRGVSLNIHEGEIVAITGKSGSGKSTLLHIIGCLDKPTEGRILIDATDPRRLSDSALSHLRQMTIGFVFQSFYLQPFLKLNQNVTVPAMFARTNRNETVKSVDKLLTQVGLTDSRSQLPKELSGGQMQRAAIARAMVNKPKIILADEPTGNLDSTNSKAIIDLFQKIRQELGTTIVIVTHDEQIARQADRIITLHDGAII